MGLFDDDPRTRRLKADHEAMKRLRENSSILDIIPSGDPPERYTIVFKGKGTVRKEENSPVELIDTHRVEIQLGIDYPRSQPYLKWQTPLYHPNIAVSGAVCLGGYSTNWTPSLTLDQLCEMLWDMVRFANYDTESPYNYRAAQWAKSQTQFEFPLDPRPLRDKAVQTLGSNVIRMAPSSPPAASKPKAPPPAAPPRPPFAAPRPPRPSPPPSRAEPSPTRPSSPPAAKAAPLPRSDDIVFMDDAPSRPAPPPPRPAQPARPPASDDDILIIE
jgi:ubiquitin-protein ligase